MKRQTLWAAFAFWVAVAHAAIAEAKTADNSLPEATFPAKAEPKVDPSRWVLFSDIPETEWGNASATTFDLTIDERGRPMKCSIIIPSGFANLDASVCAAIMRRARFKAAQAEADKVLPSVRRDRVVWRPDLTGDNSWKQDADYVVSTPLAVEAQTELVTVVQIIDSTGKVERCRLEKSTQSQALDQFLCELLSHPELSPPVSGRQGEPVRGIRSFTLGLQSGDKVEVVRR